MLRHDIPYVGQDLLLAHGQIVVQVDEELGATHVDELGQRVLLGHEAVNAL